VAATPTTATPLGANRAEPAPDLPAAAPDQPAALTGSAGTPTMAAPVDEAPLSAPSHPAVPLAEDPRRAALDPARDAGAATQPSPAVNAPAAGTWAATAAALASTPSAHERVAAATPAQGPDDVPQPPGLPLSGSTASSSVFSSATLYAILVALSALALSQFGRFRLPPVRWRCAAFVALLERPG
jgi:hypothetical protein